MIGRPSGSKNKSFHRWTEEQKEYIFEIYKGRTNQQIADMINEKFGIDIINTQVKTLKDRYKLKSGVCCCFSEGDVPWNKGVKGFMGANKTSFKKGVTPPQYRPVGSERVNADDMIEIKIEHPSKWEYKQRYIYMQHHGEIEKGNAIIFLDGNKRNFDIDNLASISRKELLILNKMGLISKDAEITKVGINIAKVLDKIKEVSK